MAPAFGFGVGDFVAVATLVWKLSQALSDVSEDSKLYRELQLELSILQGVVVQFQHAMANGAIISQDQVSRTRDLLSHIERQMENFYRHMEKFNDGSRPVEKDGTRKIVTLRKRITWSSTELLKSHIDNALQEPWDQKPIRFQGAVGRRYPVPLEVCGTFEGFLDFLQHAFRDNPIEDAVLRRSIWLFTPALGSQRLGI